MVTKAEITFVKPFQRMMSRLLSDSSRLVVLVVVVLGCLLYLHHTQQQPAQQQQQLQEPPNPLDGCLYVYLDMGTNVGVQIRSVCSAS